MRCKKKYVICKDCGERAIKPEDRLTPVGWMTELNCVTFEKEYICDKCKEKYYKQNSRRNPTSKEEQIIKDFIKKYSEHITFGDTSEGFQGFIDKYGKILLAVEYHSLLIKWFLEEFLTDEEKERDIGIKEQLEIFYQKTKLVRVSIFPDDVNNKTGEIYKTEDFQVEIWGKINRKQIDTIKRFADRCNRFYFDIKVYSINIDEAGRDFYEFIEVMRKYDLIPETFVLRNPRRNTENKEKEIIQLYIKRYAKYIPYEDIFEGPMEHGFYGFIDRYGKLLWRKREHRDFIRGLLRKILDKEYVDYADLPELYEVFFRKTKLIRADFIPGEEFDISIWGKINKNQARVIRKFADISDKFYFDIFLQSKNVSVGGEDFYKFIDAMRKYDLIPRTFVLRNPRRNIDFVKRWRME